MVGSYRCNLSETEIGPLIVEDLKSLCIRRVHLVT